MTKTSFTALARKLLPKAVKFVILGFALGYAADFAATRNNPDEPAGFLWGVAHGAFMPTTLPALAMGKDVTIYAPYNTGRVYKLGYTCGINACGLLVFGAVFWSPSKSIKLKTSSPEGRANPPDEPK